MGSKKCGLSVGKFSVNNKRRYKNFEKREHKKCPDLEEGKDKSISKGDFKKFIFFRGYYNRRARHFGPKFGHFWQNGPKFNNFQKNVCRYIIKLGFWCGPSGDQGKPESSISQKCIPKKWMHPRSSSLPRGQNVSPQKSGKWLSLPLW